VDRDPSHRVRREQRYDWRRVPGSGSGSSVRGVGPGEGCIINTSASVDHECRLEAGVHVAPGARLAGCVTAGRYATIYMGAVVLPESISERVR